jgi:hypothetical protein
MFYDDFFSRQREDFQHRVQHWEYDKEYLPVWHIMSIFALQHEKERL